MTIGAVGAPRQHCDVSKGSVTIVAEEHAGLRIDGNVNVGPSIVVEIVRDRRDGVARARLQNACLLADIGEGAIAVVVIKNVGIAWQSAWTAHDGDTFPLTVAGFARSGGFRWIEFDVIADKQIKMTIAVIVQPSAARSPMDLFVV